MGMIDRYRKPGGFMQLLSLVETCVPAKQDKFLEIIRSENPHWADAIQTKMLRVNRIFSWNDEAVAEIVSALQDLTVAMTLHWAEPTLKYRIQATFTQARRRKIEDLYETHRPNPGDIAATHVKIIETVRLMIKEGNLRFERFAPELMIEDQIEEKLAKGALPSPPRKEEAPPSPSDGLDDTFDPRALEVQILKQKLAEANKENVTLRQELAAIKHKLEQIRKIA